MSREVPVPQGDEAKSLTPKNLVKAKKIIVDSVMDQLVLQSVFPKDTEDV